MADRLASILPNVISPSQTGFIKGRSAVSNIRKALFTIDAEKAFDIVRWEWLNNVLDHLGFRGLSGCTSPHYILTHYQEFILPATSPVPFNFKKAHVRDAPCPLTI